MGGGYEVIRGYHGMTLVRDEDNLILGYFTFASHAEMFAKVLNNEVKLVPSQDWENLVALAEGIDI